MAAWPWDWDGMQEPEFPKEVTCAWCPMASLSVPPLKSRAALNILLLVFCSQSQFHDAQLSSQTGPAALPLVPL